MEHDTHDEGYVKYVKAQLAMLEDIGAQAFCAHANLGKLNRIPTELDENYSNVMDGEVSTEARADIRHHLDAALRHLRDLARIAEVETRDLEKEI